MISLINKNSDNVVGTIFFIILILLGYFTMIRKNISEVKEPIYMPVILRSAESLKIGSTVTLLGVPIGIVGSLHYIMVDVQGKPVIMQSNGYRLLRKEKPLKMVRGQFVVALLNLNRNIEMYSNYSIVTQYPTIFTVKTIDLRPGRKIDGEDKLNLKFLSSKEAIELQTKQKMPHFSRGDVLLQAENFGDPLFLLTEIIEENQLQVRRITRNFAEITDKMNRGNRNLSALLNQKGLERDAVETLLQLSILSQELGEGLDAYRESNSLIDSLKTIFFLLLQGL